MQIISLNKSALVVSTEKLWYAQWGPKSKCQVSLKIFAARLISLLFDIHQPTMVYRITIDFVSRITQSWPVVHEKVRAMSLRRFHDYMNEL
jgi:hypothetical protein